MRERAGAAATFVDMDDGIGLAVEGYGGLAINDVLTAYVIASLAGMQISSGWEIAPASPELGLVALAGDHELGLLLRGGLAPGLAPRPPPGLAGAPERVAQRRPSDRGPATPAVTWMRLSATTPARWGPWIARSEIALDWPLIVGAELPPEDPRLRGGLAVGRDLPSGVHLALELAGDRDDHAIALTLGQRGAYFAWSISGGPRSVQVGLRREL